MQMWMRIYKRKKYLTKKSYQNGNVVITIEPKTKDLILKQTNRLVIINGLVFDNRIPQSWKGAT